MVWSQFGFNSHELNRLSLQLLPLLSLLFCPRQLTVVFDISICEILCLCHLVLVKVISVQVTSVKKKKLHGLVSSEDYCKYLYIADKIIGVKIPTSVNPTCMPAEKILLISFIWDRHKIIYVQLLVSNVPVLNERMICLRWYIKGTAPICWNKVYFSHDTELSNDMNYKFMLKPRSVLYPVSQYAHTCRYS